MKKITIILSMIIALGGAFGCRAVVTERPSDTDVVIVRPNQPGPDYIWIDGDWDYRGGKYYRNQGHWVQQRKNHNWVAGHWVKTGRGWYWSKGHWK